MNTIVLVTLSLIMGWAIGAGWRDDRRQERLARETRQRAACERFDAFYFALMESPEPFLLLRPELLRDLDALISEQRMKP